MNRILLFFIATLSISIMSCSSDSSEEEPIDQEQERQNFCDKINLDNLDEVFQLYGLNASTNSLKFYDAYSYGKTSGGLSPSDTLVLVEIKDDCLWIGAFDAGSTEKYFELTDTEVPSSISVYAGYGESDTYELEYVQVGDFRLTPSTLGTDRYIFDISFHYGGNDVTVTYTYFYTKGTVSRCPGEVQGYWYDEDYLWIKDVNHETTALLDGEESSAQDPYIYIYNLKGKKVYSLTEEDVDSYTITSEDGYSTHMFDDNFFEYVKKGICYDTEENYIVFNVSEYEGITINAESQFHAEYHDGSTLSYYVEPIYIEKFSYRQGKMSLLWHNANIPKFTGYAVDHWEWNDGIKWVTVKDKHYVTVIDYTEPKLKFKIENLAYDGTRTDSTYVVNTENGELTK